MKTTSQQTKNRKILLTDKIEIKGRVTSCNRGIYVVEFKGKDGKPQQIKAKLSGKIHYNKINVYENDTVTVEVSPYDTSSGIITFRHLEKKGRSNEAYED
jgi:translation initiation factor IF-1